MAQKAETVFRNRVMHKFKEIPNSYWMSVQQKSIVGSPDVIGCVNGHFVSLEFKKDDKAKGTALQLYKKAKILEAGGMAFIIHPANWEDIFIAVTNLNKRRV